MSANLRLVENELRNQVQELEQQCRKLATEVDGLTELRNGLLLWCRQVLDRNPRKLDGCDKNLILLLLEHEIRRS